MECPFCKEEIKDGALKCKYCGSMIGEKSSTSTTPPPPPLPNEKNGLGSFLTGTEERPLIIFKCINGKIELYKDYISLLHGKTGKSESSKKEVFLKNIISFDVLKPGLMHGYIRISIQGEKLSKLRNSFEFEGKVNYEKALQIKKYIEEKINIKKQDSKNIDNVKKEKSSGKNIWDEYKEKQAANKQENGNNLKSDHKEVKFIILLNSITGNEVRFSFGWNWVFFFSSFFLGVPLFLKKLQLYGFITILYFFLPAVFLDFFHKTKLSESVEMLILFIYFIVLIGFNIFLGIKGNELSVKNYLEKGYIFPFPDSEETKIAKKRWNIK